MRHAIRLAFVAAILPAGAASAATMIHAGRLIDGVADAPRQRVTVVVDGGRIRAVEEGFTTPGAGDELGGRPRVRQDGGGAARGRLDFWSRDGWQARRHRLVGWRGHGPASG